MKLTQLINTFLDQSKHPIWMINLDFQLIYANRAYLDATIKANGAQKKLNECIFDESDHEIDVKKWKAYYGRAFKGERFEIEEHATDQESNKTQYSQITFEPLIGDDGEVFAASCQSKDISPLINQQSDAKQLIDSSLDVFCTMDEKGEFVYVNTAAYSLWGYSPNELMGKSYQSFVLEEDLAKSTEASKALMSGQDTTSFVNRYRKKDGGIAYNSWSVRWDESSRLLYCVAKDVREQMEQEEKVLRSEQRFQALVQGGYDLYAIIDLQGRYIYMSPSSTAITGIPPEAFIGRDAFEFIHPDDIEQTQFSLKKVSTEGKVVMEPYRAKNQNNEWRWVETVLTNMLDNPAVKGIVINARDITDERNLRELNREVGKLAKIGSWEIDLVSNTAFWSDEVHQIYGTDPRSFVPNVDAAIHFYREDYRELARSSFENCIVTKEPYTIEAVLVNSDNKEVWVRTTAKAEYTDGVCTRVYGSFQDIDDTKQAEIRLQSLASNLPGVIYQYIIKPDGTDILKHVSEGSKKIWGFSNEEVIDNMQLAWDGIKAGGELEKVQKSISHAIEFKTNWTSRYKYRMPSGELRTHLGIGTPTFLSDGTILFNSIVLDVTQEAKNEELLEEVTNMTRIGSWELDLINQDGESIYWSPILREIVEVDDNYDPTLTGGIEFHVGESKERIQKALDLLINEGIEFDEEILLRTAKGNERWNRCIGKSEMVNGIRTRVYGSYQDIHERKKAALELLKAKELAEENEQKMKQAQKLAHIGSWYYDVVNQVSQWSEETFNIWGLNQDLTSVDLVDHQKLIHPKDWERFNAVINNAIEKGIPYKMDLELIRSDGSYKTVNTIGDPILDENKKVIAFKGTTQDITERITIENELRSAIEKAEKSLKSLEDYKYSLEQSAIIAFTDKKGIITSVNDNFCRISKYEREELVGKTHQIINSKHHSKEFFNDFWKTITSGQVWRGEIKNKAKDGSHYWVDTTIVPFLDEQKEPLQYLAIRFDITERKKAEESLEVTTERLRIATSSGNIGIWDWDILNDKLIWDETMYKIFGVEESEFQGAYKAFEAKVHPDDLDDTNEKVQNTLKGLSKFKTEFRIVRQDKSIRYISGEAVLIYEDTAGIPTRMIGTNIDITERKVAEQEKNSLQETIENSLNEIYTFDAETQLFSYVNRVALLNLGYSEQEIKTLTPLDLKPDHTKISFNQLISPLRSNEKKKIVFFTNHKRKDGSLYPVEVHLQLVTDGNTKRFLAIILDITERKKAEEENRFKANLLGTIGQAAIATNLDGTVNYWNKAAEHIYGWKQEEALGRNIMDLTPLEDNMGEAKQIIEVLKKGQTWSGEFNVKKKDGTIFPAMIANSPIYNEQNLLSGMIGISSDISDKVKNERLLKQYTLELERSNQDLEQFAFVASHDLQEPLRMISSFMDLLTKKYSHKLDEKGLQYIYFATDGAKRMRQIILDLLDYSRAAKHTEGKEVVNINEVLSEFKQLRRKLISEKSAEITSNRLPILYTYKAAITQALHCLIDNALKYSADDTQPIIKINAVEEEKEWKLSIKDNGIGIEPEFFDKIFFIFQRLHNKDKYSGTGIGLSIAKRHVEFLGGKIWLESNPGHGTTFYFTIPKTQ